MKLSRALMAIVAALLGTLALLGTAQAAEPTVGSAPTKPANCSPPGCLPGTDTAGKNGYCPFQVTITYTGGQKPSGPNGLFTGHGTATVTNTSNGKTLTYNISGPGTVTNNPDGSFSVNAGGPNLLYTTVANSYPGVPQLAYSTGQVQFTVDAKGLTTSYSLQGQRTDVCAALA